MATHTLTGIGECMIELSAAQSGLMRKSFAGDVFNTLYYARKWLPQNWRTSFYTGLGTDKQSDEMRAFLKRADIETDQILSVPDRVPGLYMIHLDGAERSFSYWRDTSAARLLASDQSRLRAVISQAEALYISGITLAILPDADATFLIEELANAKTAGKLVAFDPNIRPRLWNDPGQMRETITRAAGAASIVLPSFDDEKETFGDNTPMATLERYARSCPSVVVKNGSGNVLASKGEKITDVKTEPVGEPVDTTGAGDSFNGAFLAEYLMSGEMEVAIKAGQSCAGRVICHHGAII